MSFYTQNQIDILAFLLMHEGEERSLSEIGEALGKLPGVFKRGIDALEREGVLVSRKRGSLRLFSMNTKHLFLEEIKSVVKKTAGVEVRLRKFVEAQDNITGAMIYGSFAKNKMRADSDIDILLVSTDAEIKDELIMKLSELEKKIGREINYTYYEQKEFFNKKKSKDAFLYEILNDQHILLKGKIQ